MWSSSGWQRLEWVWVLRQASPLSVLLVVLPVEREAAVGYRCMDMAMHRSQSHLWHSLGGRQDNPESEGEHMRPVRLGDNKDMLCPLDAALAGNVSTT